MTTKLPENVIAAVCGVTDRNVRYWRRAGKLGAETREDIDLRFGPFSRGEWERAWAKAKRRTDAP